MYDQRTDRLTPEEEEEKHITKRKMLGNIQFIGELGKLEVKQFLFICCQRSVKIGTGTNYLLSFGRCSRIRSCTNAARNCCVAKLGQVT